MSRRCDARHLSLERLVEQAAVGEAGERVARRQPLDLAEQAGVAERRARCASTPGPAPARSTWGCGRRAPPPHSPTATPRCSPSAVIGVTTTFARRGARGRAGRRRRCARASACPTTTSPRPAAPAGPDTWKCTSTVTVVADAVPHRARAHEHDRAGEAEPRARVAHERRQHVVGADGAFELGAQLDELLEVAAAVAQRPLVHRGEQRRAHREQQERGRADDRGAVVDDIRAPRRRRRRPPRARGAAAARTTARA